MVPGSLAGGHASVVRSVAPTSAQFLRKSRSAKEIGCKHGKHYIHCTRVYVHNVCIHIYIYNYMHNIYIYMHNIYIYTHTHTHTYIHTYMHTYIYIYMYVCDTPQKLKQFLSSHISVFRNCTCFFGKRWDLPQFVDILFMNLEFSRLLMYRYTYQHVISYVYST